MPEVVASAGAEAPRERLLALISAEPGINKSELCQRSGMAWGTVYHHVERLKEERKVRIHSSEWEAFHFVSGLSERDMAWLAALRKPRPPELLRLLQDRPRRAYELAQEAGLARKIVRRHLGDLYEAGLVQRAGSRAARYVLASEAHAFVDRVLGCVTGAGEAAPNQ